jgi:SpoVK/Ycf46/Vps4 family AAA+-type ATPase
LAAAARLVEGGAEIPPGVATSAIFFGPPGTSKTELTKQIAAALGWPRLIVDPSHFVKDGLDQVQAQADRIFGMLAMTEQVVVLFDEFDEMVRKRETAPEILSRFLTTSMLPRLTAINKQRRIVFIVATNHIEHFDVAISRPGRFDAVIQVMPPTTAAKFQKWPDVKTRLDRLKALPSSDVLSQLGDLTYDEFSALRRRLVGARTKRKALELVAAAHKNCILMTDHETGEASDKREKWREICIRERSKVRIPEPVGLPASAL